MAEDLSYLIDSDGRTTSENSAINEFKYVYGGGDYTEVPFAVNIKWVEQTYAIAGQLVFQTAKDITNADIHLNGSLLSLGVDYTIIEPDQMVLTKAATLNDIIVISGGEALPASSLGDKVTAVDSLSQLSGIDTVLYQTAIVRDKDEGGVFNYDASFSEISDGGTIFYGWIRQYDVPSVEMFGAIGDGVTDDTAAFALAVAAFPDKRLIYLKSFSYNITSGADGEYRSDHEIIWTDSIPRVIMGLISESGKAKIVRNQDATRDELQIYCNNDAFSTGSLGAGMHLYGNNDPQHSGNIAFLAGQNDLGDARMIISGGCSNAESEGYRTNTDTRLSIGNSLWNFVDNNEDIGTLNLKSTDPTDTQRPMVFFKDSGNDIAVERGENFVVGDIDIPTLTFKNKLVHTTGGNLKLYDNTDTATNNNIKFGSIHPFFDDTVGVEREMLMIRAQEEVSQGAGMTLYGNSDYLNPGEILAQTSKFTILDQAGNTVIKTDTSDTTILNNVIMTGLPTSNPGVNGALWNNGGVINISAG